MAAGAMHITGMITPEFYFLKTIDNSRLVKISDPKRRREIRMFSAGVAMLFLLVMFYAWQHFRSIEYGYRIEAQKTERDRLVEQNRALKLEAASLRDPGRIDALARQMGLESPQPGQVIQMNPDEAGAPIMARATPVSVIAVR